MSQRRRRDARRNSQASAAGLFLFGLIVGLAGALYYAWVVAPVVYTDASPSRLSERYKTAYIHLISQSYAADGDWARAEARLAALDDEALTERLDAQLDSYLREQRPAREIENLARLAQQAGATGAAVALFAPELVALPTETPTPAIPPTPTATGTPTAVPTATSAPTATPSPTSAPTSTPQPVYRLLSQERVCEGGTAVDRIEVITLDALLNQLPGAEVWVTWEGGSDRFFTGFKPDLGAGYGDFRMAPGISYAIALADGSPEISGLRLEACPDGADGGWRLTFQNLRVRLEVEEEEG